MNPAIQKSFAATPWSLALLTMLFFALPLIGCQDKLDIKTVGSSSCNEERGNCPTILWMSPLAAAAGDEVLIYGSHFSERSGFSLGDKLLSTKFLDSERVSFVMPDGSVGFYPLSVKDGEKALELEGSERQLFRLSGREELPVMGGPASTICSDVSYFNEFGQPQKGAKDCSGLADVALSPSDIAAGVEIGGIEGTYVPSASEGALPFCSSEQSIDCVSVPAYRSVALAAIASRLLSSQTLAGVTGTVAAETHSLCTAAAQDACVATAAYPTMDLSGASGAISDLTASGFTASLAAPTAFEFWDARGQRHQLSGDPDLVPAKIKTGLTLFSVAGSASTAPVSCSSDGESDCVVLGPSFVAAATTGLAAKVLSGSRLAGVTGNVTLPPTAKVLLGSSYGPSSSPLFGGLTLPASAQVLATAPSYGEAGALLVPTYSPDFPSPANVRATDTVNGVAGSLLDCSASNQLNCVTTATFASLDRSAAGGATGLTAANFAATIATAANFEFWDASGSRQVVAGDADLVAANIKNAVNIFGVAGSVLGAPANCSSDGQDSCLVDGGNFAAAAQTGAADKLLFGQILGGVSGNVTLPLSGKVLSGNSYGVSGGGSSGSLTLPLPSQVRAGSASYGDPTALLTPSYSPDFPALANVHSSDTVDGVAGTLGNCSAGGQTGCLTSSSYKSMDLTAASVTTDLSAANLSTVITSGSSFEFWDSSGTRHEVAGDSDLTAANISSGKTLFATAGSAASAPASCGAPGAQNCLVSGSYFAGTACGANASACFLPSYQASTQPLKAINYDTIDAGKTSILSSLNLAGVQGTLLNCSTANAVGCVSTSTYPSIDLRMAGVATGLTASNFETRLTTALDSEFWDASGTRHTISGDADLVPGKIKSGVVIHGVTGQYPSANYPLAANTATTDLTNLATQLRSNGSFEFFDSEGTRYTGSGDSDITADNIKEGVVLENLSLTGNYAWSCPTGWIKVPGESTPNYASNDFCVMKYEAKNVAGSASSQATSTPWVSISQTSAITACRALGVGYDLINNSQWMVLAEKLVTQTSNWTTGVIGEHLMISGNTMTSPGAPCAASADDNLPYVDASCNPRSSANSIALRRTMNLPNGNVIWDFSGNVWEWVNLIDLNDKPMAGSNTAYSYNSAMTGTITLNPTQLYPYTRYFWDNSWTSTKGIGYYYAGGNGSGGGLMRGGAVNYLDRAGIYAASLMSAPSSTATDVGFRCSFTAPAP